MDDSTLTDEQKQMAIQALTNPKQANGQMFSSGDFNGFKPAAMNLAGIGKALGGMTGGSGETYGNGVSIEGVQNPMALNLQNAPTATAMGPWVNGNGLNPNAGYGLRMPTLGS